MIRRRLWRECGGALAVAALAVLLAHCNPGGVERAPVLAEAYVGPATLPLREELVARSATTGAVKHGDRVDIIGRRRRFVKVRAENGAEGWVDSLQLLDPGDMEGLQSLAKRAAEEQSQGAATAFEPLNAHIAPNRQSPTIFQITPESKVDVIAHQKTPRVDFAPPQFLADMADRAKKAVEKRKQSKKKKQTPKTPPPPRGPAPAVPPNWVALSGYPDGPPPPPPALSKPPPLMDWWTLVRTKDDHAGWALTRMVYLSIPEEVAQYAERARIVSYFRIGSVRSKSGNEKPSWLWTTLKTSGDHEFDSLRVFTWNSRRGSYQTVYIERDIKGWLPVRLSQDGSGRVTGWSVVVEEKDGSIQKREYSWSGERARLAGRRPAEHPSPWYTDAGRRGIDPDADSENGNNSSSGWRERLQDFWQALKGRFGS